MSPPPSRPESPTRPAPPGRKPSYLHFTPRRAVASFENLVALANHQERLHEARKIIWRDRGEPVVELEDVAECFEHAGRGALRAAALAFNIRSGVNLFLLLFRIRRVPKSQRFALIRHALFGEDSFRFAAMLGTFVYLYKFLLNSLPMLYPGPHVQTPPIVYDPARSSNSRRKRDLERLSMSTNDSDNTERLTLSANARRLIVRKRTRRWHAIVAGAVAGGLSVLFEKSERRTTIAQQLFVRGLQGSYNSWSERLGFRVPYGSVILFSICCGHIMYACLLRPDTLHPAYVSWIIRASQAPVQATRINRGLLRDGIFDPKDVEQLINKKNTSPLNKLRLQRLLAGAMLDPPEYGPPFGPCSAIHNWQDSCYVTGPERFFQVFRFMFPVYGALNLIPAVLFKRAALTKNPRAVLVRALLGTMRSSAFLGVFVMIYQIVLCSKSNLWHLLAEQRERAMAGLGAGEGLSSLLPIVPQKYADLLVHKRTFFALGALSGLMLLLEDPHRRAELTMYTLPKALESAWAMARGRGWVGATGAWGESALTAVGMGMVMATYQNDPQHLSTLVRKIIYQFIGPN